MYSFSPVTPRVQRVRALYRDTVPYLDTNRYRIVTDFYKANRNLHGNLKRALNFANMCEKMPIWIREDELIVGTYVASYKASALYPEYSVRWIIPELLDGTLSTRETDPYKVTDEDKQYILDTVDFWDNECLNSLVNPYIPEEYRKIARNSALNFTAQDICPQPIGHFAPNFHKAVDVGFAAVKAEAEKQGFYFMNPEESRRHHQPHQQSPHQEDAAARGEGRHRQGRRNDEGQRNPAPDALFRLHTHHSFTGTGVLFITFMTTLWAVMPFMRLSGLSTRRWASTGRAMCCTSSGMI